MAMNITHNHTHDNHGGYRLDINIIVIVVYDSYSVMLPE